MRYNNQNRVRLTIESADDDFRDAASGMITGVDR